jgi:transcriptional regulator with XRE-family HTH domain
VSMATFMGALTLNRQEDISLYSLLVGAGIIPRMDQGLRDRIQARLAALGKTPRSASIKAGMGPTAIRDLFRRPDNSPSLETIRKLARSLDTTAEWLAFGTNEVGTFGGADDGLPSARTGAELRQVTAPLVMAAAGGEVQAGSFRPVDEFDDVRPPDVAWPEDEEFPGVPLVYFDVVGDSMNALKPRPILAGDRIFAIDFASLGERAPLRNGMVVVVEQTLHGEHLRERSVKQLEVHEDRYEFHPRSTNPKHKPIMAPHDLQPDDGKTVRILALVRAISNKVALP